MTVDLIESLFDSPQFMMLLKQQVQHLVGETIVQRSETKHPAELIDEINSLLERVIELNVEREVSIVTAGLHNTLLEVKLEAEKSIQQMMKVIREEDCNFMKSVQETVKGLKKEILEDRLRVEQKICSINKNSNQQISTKLKDISNNIENILPRSCRSIKMLPLSCKALPSENQVQTDVNQKLIKLRQSIEEIENVLGRIEDGFTERYDLGFSSLWKVVAELEEKAQTQQEYSDIITRSEIQQAPNPVKRVLRKVFGF